MTLYRDDIISTIVDGACWVSVVPALYRDDIISTIVDSVRLWSPMSSIEMI